MSSNPEPLIFIVDDNRADTRLTAVGVREAAPLADLETFASGEAVLERLRAGTALPNLMLLDLDMPGMGGHKLLANLKQSATLRSIPIVVFSGSTASADVRDAYANHANCFIHKAIDLDQYLTVVTECVRFWLQVAMRYPRHRSEPAMRRRGNEFASR